MALLILPVSLRMITINKEVDIMKKRTVCLIVLTLLFSLLFSIPSQAAVFSGRNLSRYVQLQAGSATDKTWSVIHPGSRRYWEILTIEEKSWGVDDRPEPLMGDANIDGKITAADALVALYFAIYGNIQTREVVTPPKTPNVISWNSYFMGYYKDDLMEEMINSSTICRNYCQYNSPFFADVTKDCVVNAKDALEILKYCVGKAEDFPVGDFTTISRNFMYFPWPTEYYPGIFEELEVPITVEEFCEKYNFSLEETPTDQ